VGNLAYILSINEHFVAWIMSYFHSHEGAHATAEGSNRCRGLRSRHPITLTTDIYLTEADAAK